MSLRAFVERLLAPGYATCGRCRRPWRFARTHTTMYSTHRGVGVLCEPCWSVLLPAERLPYYAALVLDRWPRGPDDWPAIAAAVLAEDVMQARIHAMAGPEARGFLMAAERERSPREIWYEVEAGGGTREDRLARFRELMREEGHVVARCEFVGIDERRCLMPADPPDHDHSFDPPAHDYGGWA